MEPAAAQDEGPIECKITPWFYRRRAAFAAMYLVAACLFFKDGVWSWPQENEMAARKEWFEKSVLQAFDKAKEEGTQADWSAKAKADHLPVNEQGEPVKWAAYAAEHNWPEKPKRRTEAEITQQYYWGGALTLAFLAVVLNTLFHSRRRLVGGSDHFMTPGGSRVAFADAFKVDKRKWDVQGLAYVHYRVGGQGREKKVPIDDLMYEGASRVLDRLLSHFKGELIEKVQDAETPAAEPDAS